MEDKSLTQYEATFNYIKTQLENTDELMLSFYEELNINNDNKVRNLVRSHIHDIHAHVAATIADMKRLELFLSANKTTLGEVFNEAKE